MSRKDNNVLSGFREVKQTINMPAAIARTVNRTYAPTAIAIGCEERQE